MSTGDGDEVGLRGYRVVNAARSAKRRTQVLEAGARVFSRKTYDTATMDDIAQELGVSKGVVYYQFRSKEDIFREIISTAISEALRRLIATDERGDPPAERLREAMRELIVYNLDEATPNYYAMMVIGNIRALSGSNREQVRDLQRRYQRLVTRIIDEGVAAGVFDVPDSHVTAMSILTAANGVSNWFVPGRSADAAQVAAQVSEQQVRGILAARKS